MNNIKKFVSLMSVFILFLCFSNVSNAKDLSDAKKNTIIVTAKITDLNSGEVRWVKTTGTAKKTIKLDSCDGSDNKKGSYVSEVETDFTLNPAAYQLDEYSNTSESKTDVKARLSIYYDRSITKRSDKIRVNRVAGSWKPLNSMINISSRKVYYGDGVTGIGHSAHKYPKSNSFSYTTGWGWVNFTPSSETAMSGARAFSEAVVSVSGMSNHNIQVFVSVPGGEV